MIQFRFEAGVRVRIDNAPFLFLGPTDDGWTLQDLRSGLALDRSMDDLERLYVEQRLEYDPTNFVASDKAPAPLKLTGSIADMPPVKRARYLFRQSIIEAIGALPPEGLTVQEAREDPYTQKIVMRSRLAHELAGLSRKIGRDTPISVATFYRWRDLFEREQYGVDPSGCHEAAGRREWLDPVARLELRKVIARRLDLSKGRLKLGMKPRARVKSIAAEVKDRIEEEYGLHVQPPSRTTVYRAIENLPAFDRAVLERGLSKARAEFRMTRGHEAPEACLDLVEYDETETPYMLVDEVFGVALGRPTISFFVDYVSHMPLGFYVGFEPSSDVSTAAALRHACLPKVYLRDEYPNILRQWVAYGIPRFITFDNGLTQHGDTIKLICKDLKTSYKFAEPNTPWFKSAVENMHRRLNELLLQELAGAIPPDRFSHDNFNPAEHGVLGLRHFLYIFHKWLVDVFCWSKVGPLEIRPIDRWRAGTSRVKPAMIGQAGNLDLLFGIVREGTLDHRGLVFEDMRYISDWMDQYRRHHGASVKMKVKINPTNLGTIYALGADGAWRPARARLWHFLNGRSLYSLKLVKNAARERFDSCEEAALMAAEKDLRALGASVLPMALSIRTNKHIAREMGYGTENIFNNLGYDGRLGPLSGPFAGQSLNPFAALPPASEVPADCPPVAVETPAPTRERRRLKTERFHGEGAKS